MLNVIYLGESIRILLPNMSLVSLPTADTITLFIYLVIKLVVGMIIIFFPLFVGSWDDYLFF